MFNFSPTITYGVTVCNEFTELKKLLDFLILNIDKNDEIIVLQDVTNESEEVSNLLKSYQRIKIVRSKLNGDFAAFKNNLIKAASKKYLFQIDADEIPRIELVKDLKKMLLWYYKRDVFFVPRINIVHGITNEHINCWNWAINEKGYINYPDYQQRIFKLNKGIHWKNRIHEVLEGYKNPKKLSFENFKYCLEHVKNIDKQELQNKMYNQL